MAIAGLTLMLAACANYGPGRASSYVAPAVPVEIKICFAKTVPQPAVPPRTRKQVFKLIGDLKASEDRLSDCGKQLVEWYEAQAATFAEAD